MAQLAGEDALATADIQHPVTTRRQRPQDDRVVVDVVVPAAVVGHGSIMAAPVDR
jgi:hypothetical protein